MRAKWQALGLGVVGLAMALGGCASTSAPAPSVAALPETPPPVNYGTFLGGSVGSRLPEADRDAALAAETGAIESGQRRSWKGEKGVYGYVEPGPGNPSAPTAAPAADGAGAPVCRSFTSTIFFSGRPQTGRGTGCQGADGTWHLTS